MGNVKKSIAERTRHQRQCDKRVNKRRMQMQESKVDLGKALDVGLVVMESSGERLVKFKRTGQPIPTKANMNLGVSQEKILGDKSFVVVVQRVLSKEDLKDTRIEYGFKRAFMSLFGQDDTFTSTMLLSIDQLQKKLDKDVFQEDESMEAFWVINRQFQMFIRITSIKVNGKAAYELKGKFLDDLRDNAFSGTNGKDAIEHIEYFFNIVDLIDLPNFKEEALKQKAIYEKSWGDATQSGPYANVNTTYDCYLERRNGKATTVIFRKKRNNAKRDDVIYFDDPAQETPICMIRSTSSISVIPRTSLIVGNKMFKAFPLPDHFPTASEDMFLLLSERDAPAEEVCTANEVKE
nr:hypothetical protein [Tanacetum cinerariifolium]